MRRTKWTVMLQRAHLMEDTVNLVKYISMNQRRNGLHHKMFGMENKNPITLDR